MFYVAVFHPFYDSACDKTPTTPHIGCNDHFPLQHINWNWWKWEAHPRKTQIFGSLNYKSFQTFSYLFCHLKFNQCLNWILMGMLHFEKKILPGFFISAIALKSISNSGAIMKKYALDKNISTKNMFFITVILFFRTKHVLQSVFDAKMV